MRSSCSTSRTWQQFGNTLLCLDFIANKGGKEGKSNRSNGGGDLGGAEAVFILPCRFELAESGLKMKTNFVFMCKQHVKMVKT